LKLLCELKLRKDFYIQTWQTSCSGTWFAKSDARSLCQPYGCNAPIQCLHIPFSLPPRNEFFTAHAKWVLWVRAPSALRTCFMIKMVEKVYGGSKAIHLQTKVCEYPCLRK